MIYIHYDEDGNTKAYHHSCKNIPEPYITMEDGAWYQVVKSGKIRKVIGGKLVLQDKPLPPITVQDYDKALQKHIYNVRCERGYTTRQPSYYQNSSVSRWRQDAKDWVSFLDSCMLYGLQVQNNYKQGKEVPTLQEFKKNLPKIVWTYTQDI